MADGKRKHSHTLGQQNRLQNGDPVHGALVPTGVQTDDSSVVLDVAVLGPDSRALDADVRVPTAESGTSWKDDTSDWQHENH